jgi:hypothetical protein
MATPSPQLMLTIATRHGVVGTDDLLADGISSSTIRGLVRGGVLVAVHSGVYRLATSPDSFEARCAAACLADGESVVTGLAAARLWQFRHTPRPDRPEVLVGHDRRPLTRGVLVRRTNLLEPEDVIIREDGIRIASPPRAWFDCALRLDDTRFEKLTEWVLDHHAGVPSLWRVTRRLSSRGRPGLARVRRVMSQREDWQRPAGSGLEVDVHNALAERGVGPLVRQHTLRLLNGTVIHPDVAVPHVRWAVEIDHVTWHGGRFDAQRDKARDRQARRIGWQVDRVTDQELRESFTACVDELAELFRLRSSGAAA